jgi:DMSO/TMAO reductase YedYZ molybdopterin-dependent catalytic subunit
MPEGDGSFLLIDGTGQQRYTPDSLKHLPQTHVNECYIVSTGHGTSGPFTFGGVRLADFLAVATSGHSIDFVDVVGADGFGTRLLRAEIEDAAPERSPLLALTLDGLPLTRAGGLVRLIVPGEHDDALKQVKWVERIALG